MKIAKIVGLAVFCCVSSSYGMEIVEDKNKDELVSKLSQANEEFGKAQTVIQNMQQALMIKMMTREGHDKFVATEQGKAIDFTNQAKGLVKVVLDNHQVTPEVQRSAELSELQMDRFIQKINQGRIKGTQK